MGGSSAEIGAAEEVIDKELLKVLFISEGGIAG
jgi:hypothetical protein